MAVSQMKSPKIVDIYGLPGPCFVRVDSSKQCIVNNFCKSLLVGSAPKPLPASASAVVIFTKRESRHASIACKTQESDMTVSFMSAHWRKRIWRRKILQPQNIVLVFRGLGAEPSTSFLQFGPDCIACSYANVVHLPCLPLCLTLNRNLKPFPKKRKIQETDCLYCCYSRKMV